MIGMRYRYTDLTASADAELMQLMRQIKAAEQSLCDLSARMATGDLRDAKRVRTVRSADAAVARYNRLAAEACAIPARTEQGRIAKARLLQSFNGYLLEDGSIDPEAPLLHRIAHSLSVDLAGPLPR